MTGRYGRLCCAVIAALSLACAGGGGSSGGAVPGGRTGPPGGVAVHDIQFQINSTLVNEVATPASIPEIQEIVRRARSEGRAVSIAGGRHAMGGQQFGSGTILIDMSRMDRVVGFDAAGGRIEVQAGIQWPALIDYLLEAQEGQSRQWGIIQKQTGADRLSLGGALSANIHGRGLKLKPIIADVESFTLVDAAGGVRRCSRQENAELFRLAIGGYGLFGVIASIELRLGPRRRVRRIVEVIDLDDLIPSFQKRIEEGFLHGDFQYATEPGSEEFLRRGVFSGSRPVADDTPLPGGQKELGAEDWNELYYLSHTQKKKAFERYASYYLSTSGQIYWSDAMQLGLYQENYHQALDARLGGGVQGTEMITEIYVPRESLPSFISEVREDFRRHEVNVIYGTLGVHHLQSACHPYTARPRGVRGRFPAAHRPGDPPRRKLLHDLSPPGDPGAGRALPPAVRGAPAPQEAVRPRGAVPERLVPSLSRDVRRRARSHVRSVSRGDAPGRAAFA